MEEGGAAMAVLRSNYAYGEAGMFPSVFPLMIGMASGGRRGRGDSAAPGRLCLRRGRDVPLRPKTTVHPLSSQVEEGGAATALLRGDYAYGEAGMFPAVPGNAWVSLSVALEVSRFT